MSMQCPCHSNKSYAFCCLKYHQGSWPESAVTLMRSRYSAYALKLVDYIVKTTHPYNREYLQDHNTWKKEILDFCQNTEFKDLIILEFDENEIIAHVYFHAVLFNNGQDISFSEKSTFEKIDGHFLYLEAITIK